MTLSLIIILVLLLISASFSGLETALFSLTPIERHRLRTASGLSAVIAKVLDKPRELLTTVLFGNELVNVAISILAGGIAYELLSGRNIRWVFFLSTAVTALFLLIFGEILPKNIAIRNRVMFSQAVILPYQFFSWLTTPLRYLLTGASDRLSSFFGAEPAQRMIVEEELKTLLDLGRQEGTLDLEGTLIRKLLDCFDMPVSDLMLPRQQITAVPETYGAKEVFEILKNSPYSRIPVYQGDLDRVLGVLHVKDLVAAKISLSKDALVPLLKPVAELRPEDRLLEAFETFKKKRVHMGIVRGRTGEVIGLITMEDILRKLLP